MYAGRKVETAETLELFTNVRHPYTEALLASIPQLDQDTEPGALLDSRRCRRTCARPPLGVPFRAPGARSRPTNAGPQRSAAGRRRPRATRSPASTRAQSSRHRDQRSRRGADRRRPRRTRRSPRRSARSSSCSPTRRGAGGRLRLPSGRRGSEYVLEFRDVTKEFPITPARSCAARSARCRPSPTFSSADPARRDVRDRRRVGLRQDHARPDGRSRSRSRPRAGAVRRRRPRTLSRARELRDAAPRDADDLPGPLLVARTRASGSRRSSPSRSRSTRGHAERARRKRVRELLDGSGSAPSTTTATRTSSPAASASASASPGRSRSAEGDRRRRAGVGARRLDPAQVLNLLRGLQATHGADATS